MDFDLHNKAYVSEVSHFIAELHEKDPTLASRQVAGRNRLWERQLDRQQLAEFKAARVPQPAYVYQTRDD